MFAQDTVKQRYFNPQNKEVKRDKASHVISYIEHSDIFLVQYMRLSDHKIIRQSSFADMDMDVFHGTYFEIHEPTGDTLYLEYYYNNVPVGIWKHRVGKKMAELNYEFDYTPSFYESNRRSKEEPSEIILPPPPPPPPPTSENVIFRVVENMPDFPGGMQAMYKYLSDNMIYPRIARENDIEGTVHLQFIVNKDGSVKEVEVLRGVHPVLDKEAARVIVNMPQWKAGKQRGKPVNVYYNLPVKFKLN